MDLQDLKVRLVLEVNQGLMVRLVREVTREKKDPPVPRVRRVLKALKATPVSSEPQERKAMLVPQVTMVPLVTKETRV